MIHGPLPSGAGHRPKEEWMRPKLSGSRATIVALGVVALFGLGSRAAFAAPPKGGGRPAPTSKATDMEFEPENATSTPPSKTLERAIKLYDKKDFFSASIELKKVLDGESGDDAKNKQRAEFFMGKTLYQMGFYAGSLAYFDRIVQAGDAHTYHGATLKWLAALSRVLPETSGILEKIGTYDSSRARRSVARSRCTTSCCSCSAGTTTGAAATATSTRRSRCSSRSPRTSEFFIKAKFFEGVTYVRKYEGKPAVDAFKEILLIGEQRPAQYRADDIDNYRELAQLQMARVFYSTQQFDTSIKYFEKLDQNSSDWAESLFEASWAYFMKTLNSKALGNIHTLNAPYFENQFFPESVLLKAVIYFNYCLYDQAEEAIADFNEKYSPLTKNLTDLVAQVRRQRRVLRVRQEGQGGQGRARSGDPAAGDERAQRQDAAQDVRVGRRAQPRARDAAEVRQGVADHPGRRRGAPGAHRAAVGRRRPMPARSPATASTRLARELGALSRDGSKIKFEILEAKAKSPDCAGRGRPDLRRPQGGTDYR